MILQGELFKLNFNQINIDVGADQNHSWRRLELGSLATETGMDTR